MSVITCIEDLRQQHQKNAPKAFYDYVDAGSYTESTYKANEADFASLKFRQRVAIDVDQRSTAGSMLGQAVTMPVALAPVGLTGMQWANGELLAARAAAAFGVPFTLSTMSIASIEDVAADTNTPFWFQLYVMRDRGFVKNLIARAKAANCSALMLTLDLQVIGQRHKDLKNGMTVPPKITLANVLDLATKPAWGLRMLGAKRKVFGNLSGHIKGADGLVSLSKWIATQFDPTLSWADVEMIRKEWGGKLILKGIQDPEDAVIAQKIGVDAIVVSNHGGRQLDGALSSIKSLPPVLTAVLEASQAACSIAGAKSMEVWVDGGIRSGQDVLKALALGASGTLIGRAFNYGLGAAGQAGVTQALEIIQKELDTSMALCGIASVAQAQRNILVNPY